MRTLLPTFAFVLLAAPAIAGSIEPVTGVSPLGTSVSDITCDDCPALRPKPKVETYHVDAITPGTQKVEIREADGERKMFRTEAWMGGSPVLFVSKMPAEQVDAAAADKMPDGDAAVETVDASAKTSAVGEDAALQTSTASMAASREFDPERFELRVN